MTHVSKNKAIVLILILMVLVGLAGCSDDIDPSCPDCPTCPEPSAHLQVPQVELNLSHLEDSGSFLLVNTGDESLEWVLECANGFVELNQESGKLLARQTTRVAFAVIRTALVNGFIEATILVSADTGQEFEIDVVVAHYVNEYEVLPYHVVGAAYDRGSDHLYCISDDPPRLYSRWIESQYSRSVDLAMEPTRLAIARDGSWAAVGHRQLEEYILISVVDLAALRVMDVFEKESGSIGSLAAAPNGWIYAFQASSYGDPQLSSFHPDTREETGISTRASQSSLVHLSGDYLYTADSGVTPNSLHKYDLREGVATYMYSDPHHADGEAFGRVWASDDGRFLYGWMGDVYHASTDQNLDMRMCGQLQRLGDYPTRARHIEQSSRAEKIFGVDEKSSTILTYEYDSNDRLPSIILPPFYVFMEDGEVESHPVWVQYLFVDKEATRLIVIGKLEGESGERTTWVLLERSL